MQKIISHGDITKEKIELYVIIANVVLFIVLMMSK